jgi:hypothetical protein
MSFAQDMMERKERPPFVKFVRVAIDDHEETRKQGHYVAKDVDFVNVTPAYSKDVFKAPVVEWFGTLENDVRNERFPQQWLDMFKDHYSKWCNGQEIPLNGTAIKGWGVISPAQQETLTRMNILTVEDLAAINDEGIKRVGMGAIELRRKAGAWLAELGTKGPNTIKIATLEAENALLKTNMASLEKTVADLKAAIEIKTGVTTPSPLKAIEASEIIDELTHDELVAKYVEKFNKPPHHRKSDNTIRTELGL